MQLHLLETEKYVLQRKKKIKIVSNKQFDILLYHVVVFELFRFKRCIFSSSVKNWNEIPNRIREPKSVTCVFSFTISSPNNKFCSIITAINVRLVVNLRELAAYIPNGNYFPCPLLSIPRSR